ncbi:hypothetical protein SADUNF_Sadunf19G0083300 [Salix dunnii]|uniref:Uncharacterized protein n=1 Tax=Salix dunnii TaxID=1413687 RepID=A0A835IZ21_9ROSI|nr:hypothetical protein SADUNF_Sadunf19G0083300 [Salix dunnii]
MNHRRGFPEKFVIDRMCKYSSDLLKTSLFGEKIVVFCGAPGNKFLLTSHSKYVTSWWSPSMARVWYFPENQENTVEVCNKMRIVLHEFLKPDALQDHVPVMDSMAKEQLETDWSPHKEVRVFHDQRQKSYGNKRPEHVRWAAQMATGFHTGVEWAARNQNNAPDAVSYGGTNLERTASASVTTGYNDQAPLDECGKLPHTFIPANGIICSDITVVRFRMVSSQGIASRIGAVKDLLQE